MSLLVNRYPDAPQVERARTLRAFIEERRSAALASADSSAQASVPTDTGAVRRDAPARPRESSPARSDEDQDRARNQVEPSDRQGKRRTETETDDRDPRSVPTDSSKSVSEPPGGREKFHRERGGWTLSVNSFSTTEEASRYLEAVRKRIDRWPVDLLKTSAEESPQYHLVVGQFASREAAADVQTLVGRELSAQPTLMEIPRSP